MNTIKTITKIITIALLIFLGTETSFATESPHQTFMNEGIIDTTYFVNDCSNSMNSEEEMELAKIGKDLFDKSNIRVVIMMTSSDIDNFQSGIQSCAKSHNGHWKVNNQIDKNSIYLFINTDDTINTLYIKAENKALDKYYNKQGRLDEIIRQIDTYDTTIGEIAAKYYELVTNDFYNSIDNQKESPKKEPIVKDSEGGSQSKGIEGIEDTAKTMLEEGINGIFPLALFAIVIFFIMFGLVSIIDKIKNSENTYSVKTYTVTTYETNGDKVQEKSSSGPKLKNPFMLKRKIKNNKMAFEDIKIEFEEQYTNLTSPLINQIETLNDSFYITLKNTLKQDIKLEYSERHLELLSSESVDDDTVYYFRILSKNNRITLKAHDVKYSRTASIQLELIKPLLKYECKTEFTMPVGNYIIVKLNTEDLENTVINSGNRNITYELLEKGIIRIFSQQPSKGRITIQNRNYSGRMVINAVFIDDKEKEH